MSKNRMILAVTGGIIGLVVLATAYLTWSSWSAKTAAVEGDDESDGLDAVVARAQQLSRAPVYPCAESEKAVKGDIEVLGEWLSESRRFAARGDRVYEKTTPPAFKTFLVRDAKRLIALPGSVGGAFAKSDFAFGPFRGYIAGGDLPPETQLAELQRRWDDVAFVAETLSDCGVGELVDVQFKAAEKKPEDEANARGNRKKPNKKKQSKEKESVSPVSSYSYVFSFTARPAAFVKVVNAFVTCERFVSVDEFAFRREKDAIQESIGGDEKKGDGASGGRRGRRGRAQTPAPEENKDGAKSGIVTDPMADSPFVVTMTVTVHDFRSLEGGDKNDEEEKK